MNHALQSMELSAKVHDCNWLTVMERSVPDALIRAKITYYKYMLVYFCLHTYSQFEVDLILAVPLIF